MSSQHVVTALNPPPTCDKTRSNITVVTLNTQLAIAACESRHAYSIIYNTTQRFCQAHMFLLNQRAAVKTPHTQPSHNAAHTHTQPTEQQPLSTQMPKQLLQLMPLRHYKAFLTDLAASLSFATRKRVMLLCIIIYVTRQMLSLPHARSYKSTHAPLRTTACMLTTTCIHRSTQIHLCLQNIQAPRHATAAASSDVTAGTLLARPPINTMQA